MVRTYAVWNRDKRVGIGLALLFMVCQTAAAVNMEKWVETTHGGYFIHSFIFPFYAYLSEC